MTPNIIPAQIPAPGVVDGPAPYGLFPAEALDPVIEAARSSGEPAGLAVIRYDGAPAGFLNCYSLGAPGSLERGFDDYVILHRTAASLQVTLNGVALA